MVGQLDLRKAVIDKLRTDTGAGSLVELTEHDTTAVNGYRIAAQRPPIKARLPYLGVRIEQALPLMASDVPQLQVAQAEFSCHSLKELTTLQIADRIEALVNLDSDPSDPNTNYYDFSDGVISNRSTRFKSRQGSAFDEDTEVWTVLVTADIVWINKPYP